MTLIIQWGNPGNKTTNKEKYDQLRLKGRISAVASGVYKILLHIYQNHL